MRGVSGRMPQCWRARYAPTVFPTPVAAEPTRRDDAERRQLTVMFADVARFDGFVAKYMGDGVLIYFGYPQAHEDNAERSVGSHPSAAAGAHRHRASRHSPEWRPITCGREAPNFEQFGTCDFAI
jgi:class 3 adenylate cyclase